MDRAKSIFEKYVRIHGLSGKMAERDYKNYDMSQRLRLADMVAADGHKTVADLGSQKGGMSHALNEAGVRAVSTEIYVKKRPFEDFLFCGEPSYAEHFKDLRKVNETVVCCDSFRPPFRGLDALVSYMFLGLYLPEKLHKGFWFFRKPKTINDVFDELSKSADTIYSVELQSEYSAWFGGMKKGMEPSEIKDNLEEALPDFDVEYLGAFGTYTAGTSPDERLGFKFTKTKNVAGKKL